LRNVMAREPLKVFEPSVSARDNVVA